jgi:hypothetical protein
MQSESLPKNTESRTNPHKSVDAILIRQIEFADAESAAQLSAELGYPAVAEEMKERISVVNSLRDHVVYVACIANKAIDSSRPRRFIPPGSPLPWRGAIRFPVSLVRRAAP